MKRFVWIAAGLVLALAACSKNTEKKAPQTFSAHGAAHRSEQEQQQPYYYGLIEEYRRLLAEDPNNLAGLISLANAYSGVGQWSEAVRFYQHALMIDPGNVVLRTDLGIAYRNMGDSAQALAEFRKVLRDDPLNQEARYQMGILFAYDQKEYGQAIKVWDELLHLAPHHPQAEYMQTCLATFRKIAHKEAR